MRYYKDTNDRVFAYELDGSQDHLITSDMVEITLDDVKSLQVAREDIRKETTEYKVAEAKAYLSKTDYKVLPYYELKADEVLDDIVTARAFARDYIRSQGAV